jgi:hypothetical protein
MICGRPETAGKDQKVGGSEGTVSGGPEVVRTSLESKGIPAQPRNTPHTGTLSSSWTLSRRSFVSGICRQCTGQSWNGSASVQRAMDGWRGWTILLGIGVS